MEKWVLCLLSILCLLCCNAQYNFWINGNEPFEFPNPDKWKFMEYVDDGGYQIIFGNFTADHPGLQYCATNELFALGLQNDQPRQEVWVLLNHTNGEHLVNITVNKHIIYVNGKELVKAQYRGYTFAKFEYTTTTAVYVKKQGNGFFLEVIEQKLSQSNVGPRFVYPPRLIKRISIGNGNITHPVYPWSYITVDGDPKDDEQKFSKGRVCHVVKIKVADGYINPFILQVKQLLYPAFPFENFVLPARFLTTTTTTTTTPIPSEDEDSGTASETNSNKAGMTITAFIYAGYGILICVVAAVLVFLGFRSGGFLARKQALTNGLLIGESKTK
uniref:Uncharacterized protein n=1 Tax=Panagrellus redivivus TaxID=6233 RepID=A0A7E4UL99_PANRE